MDNRKLKNILTRIDALESKDPEVAAILKSIMDCIDELDDNVDELFDSVDELKSDLDEVYDSLDDMDETIDDVLDYLGDECDGNCGECEDRDACEDSDCCDDCADDESGDDEEAEDDEDDDEDDDDYGTLDCEYDEENDMLSIACPYCEHEIFFQIEDDDVKMGGMELHCDNCDKDIAISFEMDEDGCCCGDDDCDCEGEADDCDDHGKCCGHSHRHDHD